VGLGDFVLVDQLDVLPHHALGDPREESDLHDRLPVAVELIDPFEVGQVGIDGFGRVMDASGDFLRQESLQFPFHRLAFVGQRTAQIVHRAAKGQHLAAAFLVVADQAAGPSVWTAASDERFRRESNRPGATG
jgi:hypothetical protein